MSKIEIKAKVEGLEKSEVMEKGQEKGELKVVSQGENNKYFFKVNLDPWLFLLFLTTTQIGWRKGEIIRI